MPVTVIEYVPRLLLERVAKMNRVALADPPTVSTRLVVFKAMIGVERPKGAIVAPRLTVPEKPSILVNVILDLPRLPLEIETAAGLGVIVKSH